MQDLYVYESTGFTDAFGDAKYVHSSRNYSDAFIAKMLERTCRKYGTALRTVEEYRKGLWGWKTDNGFDLREILYRAMTRHTCCITHTKAGA
jgi:hypothetical protein